MSAPSPKDLWLLGQRVEVLELRGTVLDASTSHKTEISGGGSMIRGQGSISVSSHTISQTKIFLEIDGRERSFTAPGDYELRKGHEISLMLLRHAGREVTAGLFNHSVSKSEWQSGAALAGALGIDVTYGKLAWVWRYLMVVIVSLFVGWTFGGKPSSAAMTMFASLPLFFGYVWWRKRTRTSSANAAIDQLFRGR